MKNKKNKNPNNAENAKLLFKSLVNNETAVVGARRKGWWWAVIALLFSGLVSVIPSTVQTANQKGSDFINVAAVSGYDVSFQKMLESFKDQNIEITVKNENDKYFAVGTKGEEELQPGLIFQHHNADNFVDFEAYYDNSDKLDNETMSKYLKNVPTYAKDGTITYTARSSSLIVFGRYHVVSYLYSTGKTTSTSGFVGDYQFLANEKYIARINKKATKKQSKAEEPTYTVINKASGEDFKLTSIIDYDGDKTIPANYAQYRDQIWNRTKYFFDASYRHNRNIGILRISGVMLAINIGITLFMGLMILLLTRGKQNPFRIYSFWQTQKIAYWSAIAPAILGLALGFLLKNFTQIVFPMLLGIRIMWMSMKTLRPEAATDVLLEDTKKNKVVKTVKVK